MKITFYLGHVKQLADYLYSKGFAGRWGFNEVHGDGAALHFETQSDDCLLAAKTFFDLELNY